MSRGLGVSQRLFLNAISHLHDLHGDDRAFGLGLVLGTVVSQREASAVYELDQHQRKRYYDASLRAAAAAGCADSATLIHLTEAIRSHQRPSNRIDARHRYGVTKSAEDQINPSRVLALLCRRALVERTRRGWYRLTDAGLREVRRVRGYGLYRETEPNRTTNLADTNPNRT